MDNATLRFDNGCIIFDDFSKMLSDQFVTVKIFGLNKRVVVSLSAPSAVLLPCCNVIHVVNHKCFNPVLITKLMDVGIRNGEHFLFYDDTYYPIMDK